jgi:hypothetical protein
MKIQNVPFSHGKQSGNTKYKINMRTFGNNKEAYVIKLRNTWRTK